MLTVLAAVAPRFTSEDQDRLDLTLTTQELGDIPFTASSQDATELSQQLYARAISGEFGEIAEYVAPPPTSLTFDEERAAKLAGVAVRRWRAETAGIVFDGVAVMTDRESQALITGAALQAFMDASYSLIWKTATGAFISLSATQLLAIAEAVRAHVQACFDREAALAGEIAAATDAAALAAVDIETGWPPLPVANTAE